MSLSFTSSSFSRTSLPSQPKRGMHRPSAKKYVCAASNGIGRDEKPSSEGLDGVVAAALAEPISFLGGIVAGFLALDVKQDPLKSWIDTRAQEAGLAYQAARERLEEQQRNSSKS